VHRWTDDRHLEVNGTRFFLMGAGGSGGDDDAFSLFKPRFMVEEYLRRATEFEGCRVFEAGIFRGGSTAFLATLLDPHKLVAIDLNPTRNRWLDQWLDERGQADRVKMFHGVDQADRAAIGKILDDEFGSEPLDLVIDDASHRLTPTLKTFNLMFPRLRKGGLYIIEDWSSHLTWFRVFATRPELLTRALEARPELLRAKMREEPELASRISENPELARLMQEGAAADDAADGSEIGPDHGYEKQMWRLILRIVMASGGYRDVVPDIHIQQGFAALHRGTADLDPETFDIADWLLQESV
jgi:hypothetical protein